MSIQSARDFLSKVAEDEEFRKQLGGCKMEAQRYQFAQRAGFEFTEDEMEAAAAELQDRHVDLVSGGAGCGGVTCQFEVHPCG